MKQKLKKHHRSRIKHEIHKIKQNNNKNYYSWAMKFPNKLHNSCVVVLIDESKTWAVE